MNLEKV